MEASRLFFLQYGAERVSKSLSLVEGEHRLYWEPLIGALVETDTGWVLLDTGMSREAHNDVENTEAYRAGCVHAVNETEEWHLYPAPPAGVYNWGKSGNPLETALSEVGLSPKDLVLAAVSHLHVDHSGGIRTLTNAGVPIAIQERELEFVRSGAVGTAEGFFEPDWSAPDTQWHLLNGDEWLAPGVMAISTPGHTPGHQSFRIDLPESGTWIFAGDAADLSQNFLDRIPCGSCAGGTLEDTEDAQLSLEKLLVIARRTQARLIPGHDQLMYNAIRHPKGGHR